MANLQSLSASMLLMQGNLGAPFSFAAASIQPTWTSGDAVMHPGFTVPVVEAAIPLGGLTGTLARYWFRNLDPTNTVLIKHALSGSTILLLRANGEPCMGCFPTDVTAPTWIASAGTPLVEYAICTP
jgi:hypothetical protein